MYKIIWQIKRDGEKSYYDREVTDTLQQARNVAKDVVNDPFVLRKHHFKDGELCVRYANVQYRFKIVRLD